MLKKYIRNEKGQPIGVILSELVDNKLHFGWSVVHGPDTFNKYLGLRIAGNRLFDHDGESDLAVPSKLVDEMKDFTLRSMKYFKTEYPGKILNDYSLSLNKRNKKSGQTLPEIEYHY